MADLWNWKGKLLQRKWPRPGTGNERSLSRFWGFLQCQDAARNATSYLRTLAWMPSWVRCLKIWLPIWLSKFAESTGMHMNFDESVYPFPGLFHILHMYNICIWYICYCWEHWGLPTDFMRIENSVADSQLTPARSTSVSCGVHFWHYASGASSAGKAQNRLPGWWVQVHSVKHNERSSTRSSMERRRNLKSFGQGCYMLLSRVLSAIWRFLPAAARMPGFIRCWWEEERPVLGPQGPM